MIVLALPSACGVAGDRHHVLQSGDLLVDVCCGGAPPGRRCCLGHADGSACEAGQLTLRLPGSLAQADPTRAVELLER